ncbi:ParA family protein [Vulcanisaeta distributa]|uniref:ParA family protein n=1 Tax=Vulcanisaeta distributa TaxID=164451 RepID=UPI0006CFCA70|nr:ParA family protein [Vulcanisaeta distributa]
MFTIAFISASGGAGKTTLAVNTAASLAIDGRKVLFIDFDPSAMATRVLLGRTFDECNLKTLMKRLVEYRRGYLKSMPVINECLRQHVIPGNNAAFYVLPGGNLDEISSEIKNVPDWGLLLRSLTDKLMEEIGYDFDVIILDSPNWVYQFFEMTFPLAPPLYVAITRPGLQEINKFVDFLRRVVNMLYNQKIFVPRNKNYESLVSYVVNQYRSNMKAQDIMKAWHEVNEIISREFPNTRPLVTNNMLDKYYGDEDTEFVGFRYLDEMSLDSYVESGPLYVRKRTTKSTRPIKQFEAYYKLLKQFISEMTPVEVDH